LAALYTTVDGEGTKPNSRRETIKLMVQRKTKKKKKKGRRRRRRHRAFL